MKIMRPEALVLRLTRVQGRYVEDESSYDDFEQLELDAATTSHLLRHCRQSDEDVDIGGEVRQRQILVRKDDPDVAYALRRIAPEPKANPARVGEKVFLSYAHAVRERVDRFDTLFPGHEHDFLTSYVEPHLSMYDGGRRRRLSWSGLNRHRQVLVVGPPGTGKTSLLRRIALEHLDRYIAGASSPSWIPVYLQLRNVSDRRIDTSTIGHAVANEGGDEAAERALDAIGKGHLLLLLDGLDEVREEDRRSLLDSISALVEQHPTLRVVVSSRPRDDLAEMSPFRSVSLEPFSDAQVRLWTWLTEPSGDTWSDLVTQIGQNRQVREMVTNPLALSIVTELHRSRDAAPRDVGTVAERLSEALIEDWDRCRGIRRSPWPAGRSGLRHLLSLLAHRMMSADVDSFDASSYMLWRPQELAVGPPDDELDALAGRTGLIQRKEGSNYWQFANSALLHYFAADYALRGRLDTGDAIDLAPQGHPGVVLVWMMIVSIALEPDPFVRILLERTDWDAADRAIALLRIWDQGRVTDASLVARVGATINQAIEETLERAEVSDDVEVGEAREARSPVLRLQTRDAPALDRLPDLIEALHAVWHRDAGRDIRSRLHDSSDVTVRQLASVLDAEGVTHCELHGGPAECVLRVDPSPRPPSSGPTAWEILRRLRDA